MQKGGCTDCAEFVVHGVEGDGVPGEVAEDVVGGPVPHGTEGDGSVGSLNGAAMPGPLGGGM